ncbi:MAG: efflux RND transporter periplasmic adaptor subunit [Proteobacteria bacterium]|nr:efflux RND transporter periplasmic adaptor subunit [Pseudomonadota bacterium]MCP4920835.1 efflux RND transporter periplasmic adaptor subunit [Pseudomonadota bacterium]
MTLLLLSALTGCGGEGAEVATQEAIALPDAPGVRIEEAVVQAQTARIELSLPAQVEASSDATLAAPMGGYVEYVGVAPGDHVKKGQALARIDARSRKAQHEIASAQSEQADAELARVQALGDAVSAQQLLAAETQARIARANADLAKVNLNRSAIVSPFAGRVADVFIEVGEVAGPGTATVRVVRNDTVTLDVSVNDREIAQLATGQSVEFRTQSLPDVYTGRITSIGAAADTRTRTFSAEVEVPNPDRDLLPGMIGRVALEKTVAEDAIVIPQDWVITGLSQTGVFVDVDETAVWTPIEISDFVGDQAVVSAGLTAGDAVITKGGRDLADGDPLIVVRSGVCCDDGQVAW